MSNRVDFNPCPDEGIAIPAGRAVVYLDGKLCSSLEVVEIAMNSYPEFGQAKIEYNASVCTLEGAASGSCLEAITAMGKRVRICQLYDIGVGNPQVEPLCLFDGQIEHIDRVINNYGEGVTLTAKDCGAVLERVTVYGSRVEKDGDQTLRLESMSPVFNEGNQGNATKEMLKYEGKTSKVFASGSVQVELWTCAEVILYLLNEHLSFGTLRLPALDQVEALTENRIMEEFDAEGLSLAKAIGKCCQYAGMDYKFVPCLEGTRPGQKIVFYRSGSNREVEINLQQSGQDVSIYKTNVWSLKSDKDLWPVTQRFIGFGDFKVFEATFDLIKAWDPGMEGGLQADYSPSGNANFDSVRDVYRKWCLNEGGDYSQLPYGQGDTFDLSFIFESSNYVPQKRCFLDALTTDGDGNSLGYYLEVSYDGGMTWQRYPDDFDVLQGECGIWLSSDGFDAAFWTAISSSSLRFRITASIQSDERLKRWTTDGPLDSTCDVIDRVAANPSEYKYYKVSGRSIFYSQGSKDNRDDGDDLMGHIRRLAQIDDSVVETIDITTPIVATDYNLGDRVLCDPDSRDILGVKFDSRTILHIEKINMNFKDQCTELKVTRRRL